MVWVNLSTVAYVAAEHRLGQNGNVTKITWPTQHCITVTETPEFIAGDDLSDLGI